MQKLRRKKFGEILVAEGIITREQLAQTIAVQQQTGETVGEVLLRESLITESDVVRCICTQYQLPFLRPSSYDVDDTLLHVLGSEFCFVNQILPLETIGTCVIVGLAEIPPPEVEKELQEKLEKDVFFYFCMSTEVETILKEKFALGQEQIMQLEQKRRDGRRGSVPAAPAGAAAGPTPSVSAAPKGAGAAPGGNSWESIFDEAEQNL